MQPKNCPAWPNAPAFTILEGSIYKGSRGTLNPVSVTAIPRGATVRAISGPARSTDDGDPNARRVANPSLPKTAIRNHQRLDALVQKMQEVSLKAFEAAKIQAKS
jgi:hypothetical protein